MKYHGFPLFPCYEGPVYDLTGQPKFSCSSLPIFAPPMEKAFYFEKEGKIPAQHPYASAGVCLPDKKGVAEIYQFVTMELEDPRLVDITKTTVREFFAEDYLTEHFDIENPDTVLA